MNKEQYENTLLLKQVLNDKIYNNEPLYVLDSFFQPCRTFGCVAGDFFIKKHGPFTVSTVEIFGLFRDQVLDNAFTTLISDEGFKLTFGFSQVISLSPFKSVFGESMSGTLQERLDYVNKQIELYEEHNA